MIKPFYPHTTTYPPEAVGMVLYNHVGSTVAEDTGRDAQAMANQLGIIVIAADRPGSGFGLPNPSLAHELAGDYTHQIERSGKKIAHEVAFNGLKSVIVGGRSAGGLAALALGSSDLLPISHVYAAEPVGWFATSVEEGKKRLKTYRRVQKQLINDIGGNPDLERPHDPDVYGLTALKRLLAIGFSFPLDEFHNRNVWNQPLSKSYACTIARRSPRVFLQIDFAERSLVATDGDIQEAISELKLLRSWAGPSSIVAPVVIEKVANTVHSSFDNRLFMARRLRPVVDRALQSS